MNKLPSTIYARRLFYALKKKGINAVMEYNDEFKCVDIAIPEVSLYIEVDGFHHVSNSRQIETDFLRDFYSERKGIQTLRISNHAIAYDVERIAKAIAEVVKLRQSKKRQLVR